MDAIAARYDFGGALNIVRHDKKARRAGWNGKGMWIALQTPDDGSMMDHPYLYMCDATGQLFPWSPNQLDVLALDWEIA